MGKVFLLANCDGLHAWTQRVRLPGDNSGKDPGRLCLPLNFLILNFLINFQILNFCPPELPVFVLFWAYRVRPLMAMWPLCDESGKDLREGMI